jgi:TP901 family phage tail tape measure protein
MDLLAGSANDLALITGGTLTQAINSISSVLKAYDRDITDAEEITDQFFAAIDKGRITLQDLESSLGKITPLAAKLNIGFNEVAAAMAAITQSGTTASVANTQLRSIFQKLIKPTKELQGAFNDLGAQNFQQLIAETGGLQQALTAIAGALGNDDRSIATAFGRLRGQLGVFNLLANEGKIFSDTLDAVNNSAGRAAAAADTIDATAARESQRAWAQFDETLRQVGDTVLRVQTAFIQAFNAIIPDATSFESVLASIAVAAAALGGVAVISGIQALSAALTALGASATFALGPFALAVAAGAGLGIVYDALTTTTSEALDQIDRDVAESFRTLAEESKKSLAASNKAVDDLLAERGESVDRYIKGLEKAFERETEAFSDVSNITAEALSGSIKDFEAGLDGIFSRIKSKTKNFANDLQKARQGVNEARTNLEDFDFGVEQRTRSPAQQIAANIERADEAAGNLRESLRNALDNPEGVAAAEQNAERLTQLAQKVRQDAEQSGNAFTRRSGIEKAEELERLALVAKLKLKENEVELINKQQAATQSLLEIDKARTKELGQQLQHVKDLISATDEAGKLKSPEQQLLDDAELEDATQSIKDLIGEFDQGLLKAFGEKSNFDKLTENIGAAFDEADFQFDNVRASVQQKLDEGVFKVFVQAEAAASSSGNADVDDRIRGAAETGGANPVARAEAARNEAAAILKELEGQAQASQDAVTALQISQQAIRDAFTAGINNDGDEVTQDLGELTDKFDGVMENLFNPEQTLEGVNGIKGQINGIEGELSGLREADLVSEEQFQAFDSALEKSRLAAESVKQVLANVAPDTTTITNLKQIITDTAGSSGEIVEKINQIPGSAQGAATSVGTIDTAMGGVVSTTGQAISAMRQLEQAARAAAQAAATARQAAQGLRTGGKVNYRASGGAISRGTDTQLTATTPGEVVMNARTSGKFFSQLQAMNAGQSPQQRDKGGPVTNFGDVNVNMPDGTQASDPQLARRIGAELERELRFRTSKLRRN